MTMPNVNVVMRAKHPEHATAYLQRLGVTYTMVALAVTDPLGWTLPSPDGVLMSKAGQEILDRQVLVILAPDMASDVQKAALNRFCAEHCPGKNTVVVQG
ncbi:MAG: hypothetical protein ACPGVG_08730 [Mycobacterium sp.]